MTSAAPTVNAFWTSHFDGVYIFNDERQITVIADPSSKGFRRSRPWEVSYIDINRHDLVYKFLLETRRIETPRGSWIERSGLLEQRARFLIIAMMVEQEPDLDPDKLSNRMLDSWVRRNASSIERDGSLTLLENVRRQVRNWSNIDLRDIRPEHRFLISRANPGHEDWWLTNRLITDYLSFDFLSLFVFNKEKFYAAYGEWPESYRKYVVETIRKTYLPDKRGLRERLYG